MAIEGRASFGRLMKSAHEVLKTRKPKRNKMLQGKELVVKMVRVNLGNEKIRIRL